MAVPMLARLLPLVAACCILALVWRLHGGNGAVELLEQGAGQGGYDVIGNAVPPQSDGAFQSGFSRYQAAQQTVDTEGQQLAQAQQQMNALMGDYVAGQQGAQQQLAGVYGEQPSGYTQPITARNYPAGQTYMPTMQSGVSDEDKSPVMPDSFFTAEVKSEKRLAKLKRILKKSGKMQEAMDSRLEKTQNMVNDEVSQVRDAVKEENRKLTDEIRDPSHDVAGPRGPPGIPGLNGKNGANGIRGSDGGTGPDGVAGPTGPPGSEGKVGKKGPRGEVGVRGGMGGRGVRGGIGGRGVRGSVGPNSAWSQGSYSCPHASNNFARLEKCTGHSCLLEVKYNGDWGTVCDVGFDRKAAGVVCRGLGFPAGGTARRKGGGKGPVWLSHVQCDGTELDVGDCRKHCGAVEACRGHQRDVGVCCWGHRQEGEVHGRFNTPDKAKTVREQRKQCHFPKTCEAQTDRHKLVSLYENCGGASGGGWSSGLPVGGYANLVGDVCDNDQDMCIVPGCKVQPKSLSSLSVPSGMEVTLFSRRDFRGRHMTYTGPISVDCLSWEGFGDVAQSFRITKAKPRSRSEWTMRVYASSHHLTSLPSVGTMDFVGSAEVETVNLHGIGDFTKYVAQTPKYNFVAAFYGNLRVDVGGTYTVCTNSDDGSKVWVDGSLVVNNPGNRGERCGLRGLKAGNHVVKASVFNGGGGVHFLLRYSGPDTGGDKRVMRSESATSGLPPLPKESKWRLTLYSADFHLTRVPDVAALSEVGSNEIAKVKLASRYDFEKYITPVPRHNYAWRIAGVVQISHPGTYQWCIVSSDGSRLFIDDALAVNNDGIHGTYRRCGHRYMRAGEHRLLVEGFVRGGNGVCYLEYSGRDTGFSRMYPKSMRPRETRGRKRLGSSEWRMRIYTSSRHLRRMPDLRFLDKVGSASVPLVDFKSGADFRRWVPKMPRANYAWAFYGNLDVVQAGTYHFCATSDDGSKVYVDGSRVVDNDGLHGPRERCGHLHLGVGKHTVMTDGFQHYGGAYMRLQYRGPDTKHVLKYVRSSSGKAPKESLRSRWTMRMFRAPYGVGLYQVPYDWDLMEFVGETEVRSIDFRGLGQIREVMPRTPSSQYAWAFYGKVRIHRAGNYYWCTTSDDGSLMDVDGSRVVNNDGLHGDREVCGLRHMSRGMHAVVATGFQHGGGVTMVADYSGPDTGGRKVLIPSDSSKGAPALPDSNRGWRLRTFSIPRHGHWRGRVSNFLHTGHLRGSAVVKIVRFYSHGVLAHYVPATPGSWYGWIANGVVKIHHRGRYTFCTTSDDGSKIWVNKHYIVNNDGFHGNRERCGSIYLNAGNADVLLMGWQGEGGVGQELKYSGPDTGHHKRWPVSTDAKIPGWMPSHF